MVRQGLEPAVLICRIAINEDGRGRLGQEILNDADIGFTVDVLEDQREVAPRGDFGITQHVPERGPGDGSSEWIRVRRGAPSPSTASARPAESWRRSGPGR